MRLTDLPARLSAHEGPTGVFRVPAAYNSEAQVRAVVHAGGYSVRYIHAPFVCVERPAPQTVRINEPNVSETPEERIAVRGRRNGRERVRDSVRGIGRALSRTVSRGA